MSVYNNSANFQIHTIRYTILLISTWFVKCFILFLYFRGRKKPKHQSLIYSGAGAVNNSAGLMIHISRSSNNQKLEQIFSVYWFCDETQELQHLVSAPIMSTQCRYPLSTDVGRDASHERDHADWSGTLKLTFVKVYEKGAYFLEDSFEPWM